MLMKATERWHCTNSACGCQVMVVVSGRVEGHHPHCACSQIMKKEYASPTFAYLDFLRAKESVATPNESREE